MRLHDRDAVLRRGAARNQSLLGSRRRWGLVGRFMQDALAGLLGQSDSWEVLPQAAVA